MAAIDKIVTALSDQNSDLEKAEGRALDKAFGEDGPPAKPKIAQVQKFYAELEKEVEKLIRARCKKEKVPPFASSVIEAGVRAVAKDIAQREGKAILTKIPRG